MNFSRTLVLSLLFALAVGVAVYQTRLQKQILTRSPDEVNRSVVFTSEDRIARIEILHSAQKTDILLSREGEQWILETPVRYPAESRVVEGLAMAIRMASRQPRLRSEKEWEEYGLARPEIEIRIDVPKKKAETLYLGAQAPFGNAVFARWDSERGYFLLPGDIKSAFSPSLYNLREKRVFRTPAEEIRNIYVEMGAQSYQWKKDGGEWYWIEPLSKFGEKITSGNMNRIVAALQNLHIKKFMDDNKRSRAELGFFIIHDRIKIEPDLGRAEILHFGNEVPLESAYYGFREGEATPFLMDRGKVFALLDLLKEVARGGEKQKAASVKNVLSPDGPAPVSGPL